LVSTLNFGRYENKRKSFHLTLFHFLPKIKGAFMRLKSTSYFCC